MPPRLSPQQKKVLEVAGAGGLLLLLFMLSRRASSANAATDGSTIPAAVPDTSGAQALPDFSTDNSGSLSDLTSQVSGAVGSVGTSLDAQSQQISDLAGSLATQSASIDALTQSLPNLIAPATAGTPGPSGPVAKVGAPARRAAPAPRKLTMRTVAKPGGKAGYVHHVYTDRRGHVVRDVAVRAPHRTPSAKPAPRRKPAAKKAPTRRKTRR